MKNYNEMTVKELIATAKELGIKGYSRKSKDELIALLESYTKAAAEAETVETAEDFVEVETVETVETEAEVTETSVETIETEAAEEAEEPETTGEDGYEIDSKKSKKSKKIETVTALVKVVLKAFTGMKIAEYEALYNGDEYVIDTDYSGVLRFGTDGKQIGAKNPRFGNKIEVIA